MQASDWLKGLMRFAPVAALMLCAGCAAVPKNGPLEVFDERTGATLIVVAEPVVMTRINPEGPGSSRDLATLVGVEVDHAGVYTPYLLVYRWSFAGRFASTPPDESKGKLLLRFDGREIMLTPLESTVAAPLLRNQPHAPRTPRSVGWAYAVELPSMLEIGESKDLSIQFPDDPGASPFAIWMDGRAALREFARRSAPR